MRYVKILCVCILCLGAVFVFFFHTAHVNAIQNALGETGEMRVGLAIHRSHLLPGELYMFERLRKIRKMGYIPVWKNHKYILRDSTSGEEVDPFLWKGNWLKRMRLRGDRSVDLGGAAANGGNVLFYDIFDFPEPWLAFLYRCKIYGARVVARHNRFLVGEPVRENDHEITFEGIMVRNAAVIFNTRVPPNSWLISTDLSDYGIIMKKGKRCYLPVNLESGEPLTLPAEPIVVDQAIRKINELSRKYGIDFSTEERFRQTTGDLLNRSPELLGLFAGKLLALYGVDIRVNKATGKWEIVK